MAITHIEFIQTNSGLVIDATEEITVSNNLVFSVEQLTQVLADMDAQRAVYQNLLDTLNAEIAIQPQPPSP